VKIAIVIENYDPTRGGAERAASNLVGGLLARGHNVYIFARRLEECEQKGFVFQKVPSSSLPFGLKYLSFAANVAKLLRKDKFDIIHSFTKIYWKDIYRTGGGTHRGYLESRSSIKSPLERTFERFNPKHLAILHLEKKCLQKGNYRKIVCISKRSQEEVMKYYNVPENDTCLIYNGVDIENFNPRNRIKFREEVRNNLGIKKDEVVILFVGNNFALKGLKFAIESLGLLPAAWRFRLLVLGRGNPRFYKSLAHQLRLEERILFLGHLKNIEKYYAAGDVLLLPSFYDVFPNTCLEAMASGVPVVTTKITGVAEIITNGKNSFVVERGDRVEEIARLVKLLYDNNFRLAMAYEARRLAEKYSLENNINCNIKLYEELLKKRYKN